MCLKAPFSHFLTPPPLTINASIEVLFKLFHCSVDTVAQQCKVQLVCATFIYEQYCAGTIWVNVVMHIVLEYSAILYCNIAMCEWILVKKHFIWIMGMWV